MSNLIKAYSIKYDEKNKKIIDLNEKADMFQKLYMNQIHVETERNEENSQDDTSSEHVEFEPGIAAVPIEIHEKESEEENITNELEQLLQEKQRIEEESSQIIEVAKEEVKKMLAKAESDAIQIQHDMYEKAKSEGYNDGKKKALAELETARKELEEEKKRLNEEYCSKFMEMEPAFIELVISFVRKLTSYAIEEKKDIILYLAEQAMSGVEGSDSFIIRVSKEDYEMVNANKSELLWKLKEGTKLEIVVDKLLQRNQCYIETDTRVIDCSLDVQMKNLISDLRLLSGTSMEEELPGDSNV